MALLSTALHAQTIYVNATATGANNGTTWADAFTDLQSALAQPTPSVIWIAAGTYVPGAARESSFSVGDRSLYGGFAGTETNLSQRDLFNHRTVLSGEIGAPGFSDNIANIVRIDAGTATLDGLTISDGNPEGANFPASNFGSAILDFSSSLVTVANCRIMRNHSGAVYASSAMTVVNTLFTGNVSTGNSAISFGGGSAGSSLINCTFAGNVDTLGTGPFSANGASPTIQNTIVWANVAQGGIYPASMVATSSIIDTKANTDPLFVDAAGGDFHLLPGSPAIDAGTPVGATIDADGAMRVVGAGVDIGAFEYSSNRLTVTRAGSGTGTVTSSPAAINCGATCAATLAPAAFYQLTASADSGFRFLGWGGACSGTGTCSAQVPSVVTAHFGHLWFVRAGASGANDGTSWADAFIDPQKALATAVSGDEIWIAAGTYTPDASDTSISFNLKSGVAVYGGFAGSETSRDQRDAAANVTVLSGDIGTPGDASDNSLTVVYALQVDTGAVLDGFTITGGHGGKDNAGGGIYLDQALARVSHCIITNNSALGSGGGFYAAYGGPRISDCFVSGNAAGDGGGGTIYSSPEMLLVNSTLVNNSGSNSGSLAVSGNYSPIVDRCHIRQTGPSTAVRLDNVSALIENSEIVSTDTRPAVESTSNATILNCTIIGSSSPFTGILKVDFNATTNIYNTIVWGASAPANNFNNQGNGALANNLTTTNPAFITGDPVNGNYRSGVGSPAIDAGNNTVAVGNLLDLDGKTRFAEDPQSPDTGVGTSPIIDIGAYELHPVTVSVPASVPACAGARVTLTATAVGVGTISYQWRKGGSPVGSPSVNPSFIINSYSSATNAGLYDVIVIDSLGSTATSSQINLHDAISPPNISGFTPASGAHGTSVTINGSGFDDLIDVQFNGASATITSHTSTQIVVIVPLAATTGVITASTSGCQATSAGTFTTPAFGPPALTAVANSKTMISLSWTRVGGISGYAVKRLADPALGYETLANTSSSSFVDTTTAGDHAYVYRIDAVPAAPGPVASSAHALVMTFTFTGAITQNVTFITAAQWNEVRNAADAVHVVAGLGHIGYTTTVSSGGKILLQDLDELRTGLKDALTALQLSITFTDVPLQQDITKIRKQHIDEIRNALM